MEDKLLEIFNMVLKNRGKSIVDAIYAEMHLRNDVGFDSLDLAELTARVEAEFDVDIFENGIVLTVGEIINLIKNNG